MKTIFHIIHGASYFGKIDLSDVLYQIELDKDAKMCTMNTAQRLFKMCRLLQGLKNSSSIIQNYIESTLKGMGVKDVVIFRDDVLAFETTKEQYEKGMLAVKIDFVRRVSPSMKKSNSKPVSSVSFLGYSVSREGIAPDLKHVEKIKNAKLPSEFLTTGVFCPP